MSVCVRHAAGLLLAMAAVACDDAEANKQPPVRRAAEFRSEALDTMLEQAGRVVKTRGFTTDGDTWRGFVVRHDSEVRDAPMRSGHCYVVLGAGSAALGELDLRVFDSDGAVVAQDDHRGRRAALHYCPAQSGTYYVATRATAGSGLFAVRRFEGPTGLEVRLDDLFRGAKQSPEQP